MTKSDLQSELKTAMLEKDQIRTSVLRMLISAIGYYETQKGGAGYTATDEDVMIVIQKEAKQRRDAIIEFEKAGRHELVEKEKRELLILQKYLPEQMNEGEIRDLVKDAITKTGAKNQSDMGKVMGVLMPNTKGKADGAIVSKIVREELGF